MDAVSDRDFAIEIIAACALTMVHCSRLGEELVLWASTEFGFVTLPDSHATGSSLMPQKKNADIAELARARSGRVIGDLVALLTVFHILLAYWQRGFSAGKNLHSPKFYRFINELPTIMMIAIVLLVVARPF